MTALRAFEAAGRHQSFRRAADELAVSEAAISRQVRDLERLVGAPLFWREHRAVRLNAAGERLLGALSEAFDTLDAALTEAMPVATAQAISISVEPTFASLFLVPRLAGFAEKYPDIAVKLEVGTALAELQAGQVDLAMRHSGATQAWPRAQSRHLLDVAGTPMLAEGLVKTGMDVADLREVKLLRDEDETGWERWLAAAAAEFQPRWGPVFSDSAVALQSAVLGQGAALGSRVLAAELLRTGALVAPFAEEISGGAYWLLARDFRRLSDAEATFCAWLLAEVADVARV